MVTPTLYRPDEVEGLLKNLTQQTLIPFEVIIVDGAPPKVTATQDRVRTLSPSCPFRCTLLRHLPGTAIQRNAGIQEAMGEFIAFVDDDIRLEPDFFQVVLERFAEDKERRIGGIVGYITNSFLNPQCSPRWQWYKRLRLFSTYQPGRYDYETGYPINRYLQPPHHGLKEIDFMGAGCAVWRKEVFETGLRFSDFFVGSGVLEDAHLALRAKEHWKLLEYGAARCTHLKSPFSRENSRLIARKSAVNYRYVFTDLVPERTLKQEFRFWRVQLFDLFRFVVYALRFGNKNSWLMVIGKIEGIFAACRLRKTASKGTKR